MAINKKLIHFNTKANFITKKLSANVNDTLYYTYNVDGSTTTVTTGAPDIKYSSIVFIKDTKEIWTHGQLYDGNSETVMNLATDFWDHANDGKLHVPVATEADKILFSKADGSFEWKLPEDNMYIGTTRLDLDDHINNNSIHVPTSSKDPAGHYQHLVVNSEGEREWVYIEQDLFVSDMIQATTNVNEDLTNHKNNTKIHVPSTNISNSYLISRANGEPVWESISSEGTEFYDHITNLYNKGLKHIPSGGSSGNILSWSSAGVAQWQDPANAIPNATSIKDGLMSNIDKSTLDSLSKYILLDELNSISMDLLEENSIYMLLDDLNRCIGWVKTGGEMNFLKVSGNLYYDRTTNLFAKAAVSREFYVRVKENSFDVYSPLEYDEAYIDLTNKKIKDIEGHTLTYKDLYPGRKIVVKGINKTDFTVTREYPGICITAGSTYIRVAIDSCLFEIDLNLGMVFAAFRWSDGKVI